MNALPTSKFLDTISIFLNLDFFFFFNSFQKLLLQTINASNIFFFVAHASSQLVVFVYVYR